METYGVRNDLISKKEIEAASEVVRSSKLRIRRTPCILVSGPSPGYNYLENAHLDYPNVFNSLNRSCQVYLKLENTQNTGSFKIRGVANQLHVCCNATSIDSIPSFVTMSAGNYGRTFAFASKTMGLTNNYVLMPETAPMSRKDLIERLGVHVEMMPSASLMEGVRRFENEKGSVFLHPFDDCNLIAGYGSLGVEILKDVTDVDVVLVCCGGGGLLAGTSTALRRFSTGEKKPRVFGVEPETANGIYRSMKEGKAAKCPEARSIAAGLAPPFAGENAYNHIKEFVEDIILVSESELKSTVHLAYSLGLVVEPSGCAGLAALLTGKVGKIVGTLDGLKIVVVLTGGNVTPEEIIALMSK